jgi:hypothetical protein
MKRVFVVISLITGFALLSTGCVLLVGAGAGAGAIAYIKGESIRTYDSPMKDVTLAAQKAFTSLTISATGTNIGEIESTLEGTMKDESKVTVKFISKTPKTTEVKIRVGVIENKNASERIHEEILKNLK